MCPTSILPGLGRTATTSSPRINVPPCSPDLNPMDYFV
uniref:Uncharacterized protein n=1 Tax=Lepeophtheirus salmonis TaxID=72036 RepID=A0A0K2UWE9_LEPSM